ncbi:Chromatin modification-related protein YNG2 [Astathelohania contejeani]|uniref:Chromatin modification-related protein YNG2 n=1 Tax=Astathelohania contejeani TaxID=164912 RepID=A0ABQ7I2M6_9MICR|nr:Chromatin modification-related protein YNG2 [Thelohania contejeani]
MDPFEIIDSLLNEIQTFPLDTQYYLSQIKDCENHYQIYLCKYIHLYRKALYKEKAYKKYRKKLEKYSEKLNLYVEKRCMIVNSFLKKVKEILNSLDKKITNEELRISPPILEETSCVVRTGRGGDGESVYCICRQPSYGDMIECESVDCSIGWFHFGCVGLSVSPKGCWYCSRCKNDKK